MDRITVARRCANLTREMLEVAEIETRAGVPEANGSGQNSPQTGDRPEPIPTRQAGS